MRYRTQYQVTREHRAFNPVLQTYTDPQKVCRSCRPAAAPPARPHGPLTRVNGQEAQVAAEQRERALQTMNQARDRELRFAQRYDVVNHAPRVEDPSAARQAVTKTRIPDTRTPYDVVNHIDNSRKPWHDPRSCVVAAGPPPPPSPANAPRAPAATSTWTSRGPRASARCRTRPRGTLTSSPTGAPPAASVWAGRGC